MNAKQQIEECRRLFGKPPRGVMRLFHGKPRHDYQLDCGPDQPPMPLCEPYKLLLEEGRVVWAAIVQGDPALYQYGSQDFPASIVYSLDPFYDGVPGELENIGQAICQHRLHRSKLADFYNLAAILAEHPDRPVNEPVPRAFCEHHPAILSWTLVHRRRLPAHYLSSTAVPLVIAPRKTPYNMILPLGYWPGDLQNAWHHLNRQNPPDAKPKPG
jgi:hypothetical protein